MEITQANSPALPNRLLYFRNDDRGRTWTEAEFTQQYGFQPDGVNAYYGINNTAVAHWQMKGEALRSHHRALVDDLLAALLASERGVRTLNLGLWPFQAPEPFSFVENHLSLVETLAVELDAYQKRAAEKDKRLDVVVRYASEMNDPAKPGQPWGRGKLPDAEQREAYRRTFAMVRERFRLKAPEVRFAFSPAIRSDIRDHRYADVATYWPGDGLVDVVSCTWYVGRETDFERAVASVRSYFLDRKERQVAFGIDEIGGINEDVGNDAMLQRMFGALAGLASEGIRFDYATLFLGSKWGKDATLEFLATGRGK
ncbi:MAG: hypothetical protein ACO1SX_12915 [Actinomycetota bacterium]